MSLITEGSIKGAKPTKGVVIAIAVTKQYTFKNPKINIVNAKVEAPRKKQAMKYVLEPTEEISDLGNIILCSAVPAVNRIIMK